MNGSAPDEAVRCRITRWISDVPQPGWIEVELRDAHDRIWLFHDKPPVFSSGSIGPATILPIDGVMRCVVRSRSKTSAPESVTIETVDCESDGGERRFEVRLDQLVRLDDTRP